MQRSPQSGISVATPPAPVSVTRAVGDFRAEFGALDRAFGLSGDGGDDGLQAMDRDELLYLATKLVAASRRISDVADVAEKQSARSADAKQRGRAPLGPSSPLRMSTRTLSSDNLMLQRQTSTPASPTVERVGQWQDAVYAADDDNGFGESATTTATKSQHSSPM